MCCSTLSTSLGDPLYASRATILDPPFLFRRKTQYATPSVTLLHKIIITIIIIVCRMYYLQTTKSETRNEKTF